MRLRAAQLACLLLLLTSMSAAERSSCGTEFSLGGHYISALLRQNVTAVRPETPFSRRLDVPVDAAPAAFIAVAETAWTMRPPSAHSVGMQAATGSGI